MHVAFALFEGDRLITRGGLLLRPVLAVSCYGEHRHSRVSVSAQQGSRGSTLELFAGLVIEHRFILPSCLLTLRFFEVLPTDDGLEPLRQVKIFEASVDMPVHESDDWESLQLGSHTLAFSCFPMFRVAAVSPAEA
jgi:hypothetical protein